MLLSKLSNALALLAALGPLIIFHELGHYLVARWFDVKVARFSIGFGRVLWSRRFGPDQTEWAISAVPLGGYVKWADSASGEPDQPPASPADQLREFTRQNVWRRIAITAAGPLANFAIAITLFTVVGMYGEQDAATRLQVVEAGSSAYAAGLRGNETVVGVNGAPVRGWTELRWEIMQAALNKRTAQLEIIDAAGARHALTLPAEVLGALKPESDMLGELGLAVWRPVARIGEVMPDGAARRAGLLAGDVVRTIDGKPMTDGLAVIKAVRAAPGRTLSFGIERAGQALTLAVTPAASDGGKGGQTGKIAAEIEARPATVTLRFGPVEALTRGAAKTWGSSVMTLQMIGKIITAEASPKNISGIFTMADYAGQSASLGLSIFLGYIAFISISLGVMNLLPIPVLDGGFLLYYSLEVLTGRPLPERVLEISQLAGLFLLVALMVLAHFNDAVRYLF